MVSSSLVFLAGLACSGILALQSKPKQNCDPAANELKHWGLSVRRYRNESGKWIDLSATGSDDRSDSSGGNNMDVKATLFECDGRRMIRLQGTFRDTSDITVAQLTTESFTVDQLKFHNNTGPNAVLSNNGYTLGKIRSDGTGVGLTHRPLKPNELFEVKMDEKATKYGYANGIGITTKTPNDGNIPGHMNELKNGTWMLYASTLWHNGAIILSNYASTSLYDLKPGDRMGVMRTDSGSLHFFINGVDQGSAIPKIPDVVYGAYELFGDANKATIVHPS